MAWGWSVLNPLPDANARRIASAHRDHLRCRAHVHRARAFRLEAEAWRLAGDGGAATHCERLAQQELEHADRTHRNLNALRALAGEAPLPFPDQAMATPTPPQGSPIIGGDGGLRPAVQGAGA